MLNLVFILQYIYILLFIDSKEIIHNSIKNYVIQLFKKIKNKESKTNQTKKFVNKSIINNFNSNEIECEKNIQSSSESGNYVFFF